MGTHEAPDATPEVVAPPEVVQPKVNPFVRFWRKLGLNTWADWRNTLHLITPVLVLLLTHWVAQGQAEAIGLFVVSVVSPAVAFWHSRSTLRAWIYGLVVPTQAVLVAFDVVTQAQFAGIAATLLAVINAVLASANTATAPPEGTAVPTVGEKIKVAIK